MLKKILYAILLFFFAKSYVISHTISDLKVRVLLNKADSFSIFPYDKYILTLANKKICCSGVFHVSYHKDGIKINRKVVNVDQIKVCPSKYFTVNKIPYRGSFAIHRKDAKLYLVNHINIEEYLFSVVPSEVYLSWSDEMLKAQAVVSRTFALYHIKKNPSKSSQFYDLYASASHSQSYKGIKSEHKKTTQAVTKTASQVLTYDGNIIKSYFSSSVGGMSAAGSEIGDNQPYLQPVLTILLPSLNWKIKIPLSKIQKQLGIKNSIKKIAIKSRTKSQRIDQITIVDSQHNTKYISGYKFREKIGNSVMKSTRADFCLSHSGILTILGKGNGHGVGMGQWEAQDMAKKGKSYAGILKYFYKGSKLTTLY